MTKTEGSGSGTINQRHGTAYQDPDPPQNVMDPQHCLLLMDPDPDPRGQKTLGSGFKIPVLRIRNSDSGP
jgi:hypothetical protein